MFAGAAVGGAASGAVNFGSRMAARGGGAGGGAAGAGASGAGGGGAATGAAAAKGAGAAAAGAATGGAGLALMAVGAAAKKSKEGAHALQSAVHDAAGEQAPPAPKESKGGGGVLPPLRGSRGRSSGSRPPAPSHDDSGSAPRPIEHKKQEKR